jgi:hypothetical protein
VFTMPGPTLPPPTRREIRQLVDAHARWIERRQLLLPLGDPAQAERLLCAAREAGYASIESWALELLDREAAAALESAVTRRRANRRAN